MRTRFLIVTVAILHAVFAWGENTPMNRSAELPLVIPHPHAICKVGNERVILGESGQIRVKVVASGEGYSFYEATKLLETDLRERGLKPDSRRPTTTVVLATRSSRQELPSLTPAETAALARNDQAYVIRMETGRHARVWIIGASPRGVYYGAATLVQLTIAADAGAVILPNVEVQDYPDTPGRMCADWVLTWDWEINGYDWGDGLEAFLARCKRKIDLCSRFKVNQLRFLGGRVSPGPDYMKDRYQNILRFALELNRYARRKGVGLQYASTSFGIDHYGWGLPYPEPWILNRKSYPDGTVYSCIGGTTGSCLSNDALIEQIARRQKQLVQDIEPSSLYLHNIDIAMYKDLAAAWRKRCPRCRELFPNDEPYSPRGYAAAAANLYNCLTAELRSVKNATSGYDAARDLEIVFASPGYSYWTETDAEWGNDLKYFSEIARQVKDKRNVQLTFREQYNRLDNCGLRTAEMARALEKAGWTNAMFMFAVQGADFLDSPNLLVSSPVLTGTYRGVGTLYNFNGHVFSELQVLANVNYAWNHRAPGSVDPGEFHGAALREEAARYSSGRQHSEYLYGQWLDVACAALYGKPSAPFMANFFRLERDHGPIMPLAAWVDYHWKDASYDWRGQADRNRSAKQLVDQAAAVCEPDAKADLVRLSRCLEVLARISLLCDGVYREKPGKAEIDARAHELLDWLNANFQFEITEPDGGDPGLWRNLVTRLRNQ
jgi:hypothetical protein